MKHFLTILKEEDEDIFSGGKEGRAQTRQFPQCHVRRGFARGVNGFGRMSAVEETYLAASVSGCKLRLAQSGRLNKKLTNTFGKPGSSI